MTTPLRAPFVALCSVAAIAALRPSDPVVVISAPDTDDPGDAASHLTRAEPVTLAPAQTPQPDAFTYEFLRSEELAATPLIASQPPLFSQGLQPPQNQLRGQLQGQLQGQQLDRQSPLNLPPTSRWERLFQGFEAEAVAPRFSGSAAS